MTPPLNEAEIFEKITQVMTDLFDLDRSKLTRESRFQDLEITSIDAIDLVVELQRITGKKLSSESGLKEVRTIGDVVSLVQRHIASGN
jgi:acyl carrier protein